MSSFFAYLSRMRLIDRWALMRNTQSENVLEHSAQVAMLAHALATIDRCLFGRDVDPDRVGMIALFHESGEVLTGDMPTPVKYYNKEITEAYKRIEGIAEQRLLGALPAALQEAYRPLVSPQKDDYAYTLVKYADKLAAYGKCIEEMRMGNMEFKSALRSYEQEFATVETPCVQYFLEHFMPAFGLSLDEIKL